MALKIDIRTCITYIVLNYVMYKYDMRECHAFDIKHPGNSLQTINKLIRRRELKKAKYGIKEVHKMAAPSIIGVCVCSTRQFTAVLY